MTTTTAIPLYWAAWGPEGAPQLLVLHGGPGAHHDYLLPQMLELASDHELIFYDQRGGGQSRTDARDPITWETHVEDLVAVASELTRGPLSLIGYSWGGLLALLHLVRMTQQGAAMPARLVLIDPAPANRQHRATFEDEFMRRQTGAQVAALREQLAASGLRERDAEAYRRRSFALSVAGYFADPTAAHDLTPFRVLARVQQSVWESLGDYDILADLERIAAPPTLVVHGRADPIPLASSEATAAALRARLVVIEDSGHVPYVEQPRALFSAIRTFLDETTHLARG